MSKNYSDPVPQLPLIAPDQTLNLRGDVDPFQAFEVAVLDLCGGLKRLGAEVPLVQVRINMHRLFHRYHEFIMTIPVTIPKQLQTRSKLRAVRAFPLEFLAFVVGHRSGDHLEVIDLYFSADQKEHAGSVITGQAGPCLMFPTQLMKCTTSSGLRKQAASAVGLNRYAVFCSTTISKTGAGAWVGWEFPSR